MVGPPQQQRAQVALEQLDRVLAVEGAGSARGRKRHQPQEVEEGAQVPELVLQRSARDRRRPRRAAKAARAS